MVEGYFGVGFRMGKWGEQLWSEAMHIDKLDHFVLTVTNVEATCEFYSRVLGMQVVTFGNGRKAFQFGQQKINLHQRGQEIDPKATPAPLRAFLAPTNRSVPVLCLGTLASRFSPLVLLP